MWREETGQGSWTSYFQQSVMLQAWVMCGDSPTKPTKMEEVCEDDYLISTSKLK